VLIGNAAPTVLFIATPGGAATTCALADAWPTGWQAQHLVLDGDESTSDIIQRLPTARPQLIVLLLLPQTGMRVSGLDAVSPGDWERCLSVLPLSGRVLQSLYRTAECRSGCVIVLGLPIAQTGAAGLVPLSALLEGQRSLAKAAAREWGAAGLRVHWVGMRPECLIPPPTWSALPRKADRIERALPEAPGLREIAAWLALFGGHGAAAMTGTSALCDGGEWMLP